MHRPHQGLLCVGRGAEGGMDSVKLNRHRTVVRVALSGNANGQVISCREDVLDLLVRHDAVSGICGGPDEDGNESEQAC